MQQQPESSPPPTPELKRSFAPLQIPRSQCYRLLIDETRKQTAAGDGSEQQTHMEEFVVGVLVTEESKLPTLFSSDVKDDSSKDNRRKLPAMENALNDFVAAEGRALIGFSIGAGHDRSGGAEDETDRRARAIAKLVRITMGLIPTMDSDGSDRKPLLHVGIERENQDAPGSKALIKQLLSLVVAHRPDLELGEVKILKKLLRGDSDSRMHESKSHVDPHLAYADVLAWYRLTNPELLREKGIAIGKSPKKWRSTDNLLALPFFNSGDEFDIAVETWEDRYHPSYESWCKLLLHTDQDPETGIAGWLLERCGHVIDVDRWSALGVEVGKTVKKGNPDLGLLVRQVNWLDRWKPAGAQPPDEPVLNAAWELVRYESSNHLGSVEEPRSAIEPVRELLTEESPILLCQWDLVRAVRATNRFDFNSASEILKPWSPLNPLDEIITSTYRGRVLSSLGQHRALSAHPWQVELPDEGMLKEADEFFHEALQIFTEVVAPLRRQAAHREACQTGIYWALNSLDLAGLDRGAKTGRILRVLEWHCFPERALSLRLPRDSALQIQREILQDLGEETSVHERYPQHLLLRYLIDLASTQEKKIYLQALRGNLHLKDDVHVRFGHPLELIRFYQGMLLVEDGERDEALRCLESALRLAFDERCGPTVHTIGLVLELASRSYRAGTCEWIQEARKRKPDLRRQLPAAEALFDALDRLEIDGGRRGAELVRRCLPFNFR